MDISSILLYVSLFVSLFFEVFLLITYFEIKEEVKFEKEHSGSHLSHFPSVTIIVPCFNEEKTVAKTLRSLLALDYPQDKLKLLVVDDGSTDNTQQALDEFRNNPHIKIFKKENGGKHTALNFALERIDTELVGCLDADSFVDSQALKKIVGYFDDEKIMSVTPAVRIHEPQTVLQHIQKVEYSWGILFRRVLASINGLYVTPGPFSIFRTKIFNEIGGYRKAYHTEDMELALRMQKHGYKIANAPGAYVYTVGPERLKGLYKQRVRWTYGFLNNAIDYRDMYFNTKYGNIGIFVLPIATFSIFSSLLAAGNVVWSLISKASQAFTKYQAVGLSRPHLPSLSLNLFSLNTSIATILTITAAGLSLMILYFALEMTEGKARLTKGVFYYVTIFVFIVPLWLAKATYSTLTRKSITWR